MREVLRSERLMYLLYETDEDELLLEVVCGGVGSYTAKLLLDEGEKHAFQSEGQYAVDRLALRICRNPEDYLQRTFD